MYKKSLSSKFNSYIILSILISIFVISVTITGFMLYRFNMDVREKDQLHLQGLASNVKGFIDHAFSLNYLLSINPVIIRSIIDADIDWNKRVAVYDKNYDITSGFGKGSGHSLLTGIQKRYDYFELLFVQDSQGDQTARSYGKLGKRGERWWYKKIASDKVPKPFISKSYYSMTGNKPVTSAFHPVFDNHSFVGIMGSDINFNVLQDMVNNYLYSRDLHAIVLDNKGVIIAHEDRDILQGLYDLKNMTKRVLKVDTSGKSIQSNAGYHQTTQVKLEWSNRFPAIVNDCLKGKRGFTSDVVYYGINSTVYYESVSLPGEGSDANYAVMLIRDNSSVNKTKFTICTIVFIFTLLTILITILLFRARFNKIVLGPVRALTSSMEDSEVAGHKDVEINSSEEFQVLAVTYNRMRRDMFYTNEQLVKLNKELEESVKECLITEDALKVSEEKYRLLVENANEGIIIVQKERIKYANPIAAKILSQAGNISLKLNIRDIIHPDDRDLVLESYRKRIKGETPPSTYTFRIINKEGSVIIWCEINAVKVQWENEPGVLAFIRNITKQKKLEESLQHSRKMEAIGTLSGGIAHDFNNMLGSIVLNAELAYDELPQETDARYALSQVLKASNRAKDLVKQILTFSSNTEVEQVEVKITDIVMETVVMLKEILSPDISIQNDIPKDTGLIIADPTQMQQLVMNLCTNAAHAMEEKGGILKIELKNIHISKTSDEQGLKHGSYVRLSVTDSGKGIPPENIGKIFDPFFTTKQPGKGTGLGLSVVHGIVLSSNGIIRIESDIDIGTTFHIFFPRTEIEHVIVPGKNENIPVGSETILLVDDDTFLDVGERMLERLGYEVFTATSGVEVLDMFEKNPERYDLVIVDMTMPEMNGLELSKKLLEIYEDIPIIICTGHNDLISSEISRDIAIRDYVMKPFVRYELASIIRGVLD